MSVAATLGIEKNDLVDGEKYDPTQPALRLDINTEHLPADHPVVHWPSLVIVYEKDALKASGDFDPELLKFLEKREKIYNLEESDSEEEGRKHNMSYDSDDSFIDDDVEDGDMKVRTKVGGFFVATGDKITVEKIEEKPQEPKKEKKKQKRKRDSSDDDISPEVTDVMNKLRKKIASEAAYTKDTLAKISKDTTAKLPLHRAVLPFLLKIDLKMEKEKAAIRNKVFGEICSLIPYTNKNHKNLTELVERFSETVIDEDPSDDDIQKLKLEWYLKSITKRRNDQRKRTQRKIKKALEKAKKEKVKISQGNRPGWQDLRTDIYQIGLVCNKYAKLKRLSGSEDESDQKSRDEVFQKLIENFPKECKIELKAVRTLWESERKRAEGTKKKESRKRAIAGTTSPRKKQKRKGPIRSKKFAALPKDPWNETNFIGS